VDSGLPTKTSVPVTSKPRPQVEQSEHAADPIPVAPKSKAEEATSVSGGASGVGRTKASPSDSNHDSPAGSDTTTREASDADEAQEPVATWSRASTQVDSSNGVAAILSVLLTRTSQGTDTDSAPQITPASDPKSYDISGGAISVGSEVSEPPASASANIAIAGKTMAALKDGDVVLVDSTKLTLGQVASLSGTQISVASDGIVIGSSRANFQAIGASGARVADAVTINSKVYPASHLPGQSNAALVAGHVISHGGPPAAIAGQMVTYGSNGLSVIVDLTAPVTIDGTVLSASILPGQPDAVLLAGHTLSQGGAPVTINGQTITYGPNGISVVGDSAASVTATATIDHVASVFTIDGTAYTATPVLGRSGVVVLQSQTVSIGGSGVTVAGRLVTEGSEGVSVVRVVTSSSLDDAESSGSKSTTDVVESYTSGVQQNSAATSEPDESSAAEHGLGFGLMLLGMAMLLGTLVNL
jgi:hypothetical protein